jgi:hypothetical protein
VIRIHTVAGGVLEIATAESFTVDSRHDVVLYDEIGLKVAVVVNGIWVAVVHEVNQS